MTEPYLIEFSKIGEEAIGFLSVAENNKSIPFEIKRVYWVYDTPESVERGNHAHREGLQILIPLNGALIVNLENKEGKKFKFILEDSGKGLFIPPMHWRTLRFRDNASCLCLSSTFFDEDDYIREYGDFKK